MIEADIEEDAEDADEGGTTKDVEQQIDRLLSFTFREIPERQEEVKQAMSKDQEEEDGDLRFFRLENLIQRRPFLLSNVVLR